MTYHLFPQVRVECQCSRIIPVDIERPLNILIQTLLRPETHSIHICDHVSFITRRKRPTRQRRRSPSTPPRRECSYEAEYADPHLRARIDRLISLMQGCDEHRIVTHFILEQSLFERPERHHEHAYHNMKYEITHQCTVNGRYPRLTTTSLQRASQRLLRSSFSA